MNKTRYHVIAKKIAQQKRDVYRKNADANEFDDVRAEDAEIGETVQYVQPLTEAGAEEFRKASNLLALRKVETVYVTDDIHGEVSANYTLPDAKTLAYMGADKLPASANGAGVTVIGGDTGMAARVANNRLGNVTVLEGINYTTSNSNDTNDRHGHGTGTGAMCVIGTRAAYMPHKVLGDDGSGSSEGIVKSFYAAGRYAEAHPNRYVVYNGSFGSDNDEIYEPYEAAIKYATDRGVRFVFSAGNANRNIIGSPANVCRVNPRVLSSIAFDKSIDRRANFSNYDYDGSMAAPGVKEVGYRPDGSLYYWSGTSFSAPQTTYVLVRMLSEYGYSGYGALKNNTRDSSEPSIEEGKGVIAADRAVDKFRAQTTRIKRMPRWKFAITPVIKLVRGEKLLITFRKRPVGKFVPTPEAWRKSK